ncbi:MAG: Endonuclease/exonuclease/phosphatase [Alphaproteobacteria bacterium]|jgi:endonuclease/exonuclease/phosphatase (EEP) superfamily protein YafD|nr:Endonuclease/exonuclease/phosphatase [Alphaproteobacteria bacterium]
MTTVVFLIALLLFLASLTPYIPLSRRATDLPSHFSLQYLIGTVLMVPVAASVYSMPNVYFLLAGAALASLAQLIGFMSFGSLHDPLEGDGPPLKILQVNVLMTSTDTVKLKTLVDREKPDLIVACEVNGKFALMLRDLNFEYPHQMLEPRDDRYGMAVLSRRPLEGQEYLSFAGKKSLAMGFRLRHEGREIEFLSMHPQTPLRDIRARNHEFAMAVKHFGKRRDSIVVLGDLNATPYCHAYKKLVKTLGLKNAREGQGLCGTFPVFLPLSILHLPIDHVLTGANLVVREFRRGPDIGSDHFPTITTLSVVND